MKDSEHVLYTFFGDLKSKEFKTYSMIAQHDDFRVFSHTDDPEAFKKYNVKTPNIVAFRHFDEPVVHLKEEFNRINAMDFIREAGIAKCMYFHEVDKLNIFRAKNTALFLILDGTKDQKLQQEFCKFAQKDNSKMLYAWADIHNKEQEDLLKYINVTQKPVPHLAIVHFDPHYGLMRYDYDGVMSDLSYLKMEKFIDRFRKGGVEREYYDDQDKLWYHVTHPNPLYYNNFEEIVMNKNADVLVYFYSTGVGNDENLEYFYKEMDQISKENGRLDDFVTTKYDWHKDPPVKTKNAKPNSIVLYTKGDKQVGIVYEGEKSIEGIKQFLIDNSPVYRERFGLREDL